MNLNAEAYKKELKKEQIIKDDKAELVIYSDTALPEFINVITYVNDTWANLSDYKYVHFISKDYEVSEKEKPDLYNITADKITKALTSYAFTEHPNMKFDNEMTNDVIEEKITELLDIIKDYEE